MQILSPLICGAYHPEEEEALKFCESLSSTPRKSRNKRSSWSRCNNKNPYAQRGLDKFSELLADLEDKRKKIYLQKGSHDITLIRFVYSDDSNDCKPIIVKQRDKMQKGNKSPEFVYSKPKLVEDADASCCPEAEKIETIESEKAAMKQRNYRDAVDRLRRPSYYFAAVLIFILVFLTLFGRSAAVFFTSIGWYVLPTIKARISSSKKSNVERKLVNEGQLSPTKKKKYVRKLSESKMAGDGAEIKDKPNGKLDLKKSL